MIEMIDFIVLLIHLVELATAIAFFVILLLLFFICLEELKQRRIQVKYFKEKARKREKKDEVELICLECCSTEVIKKKQVTERLCKECGGCTEVLTEY